MGARELGALAGAALALAIAAWLARSGVASAPNIAAPTATLTVVSQVVA